MALVKGGDLNEAKENFGFDLPWAGKLGQTTHSVPLQPD